MFKARNSLFRAGRIVISYPWALSDCPDDVQEKIFDELLAYLKTQRNPLKIVFGVRLEAANMEKQLEFSQKKDNKT